jgi:hypothetical protein
VGLVTWNTLRKASCLSSRCGARQARCRLGHAAKAFLQLIEVRVFNLQFLSKNKILNCAFHAMEVRIATASPKFKNTRQSGKAGVFTNH